MLGLVAPPEQLEVIGRIQAMMSLLEGHGDVTMDRAGADAVPDAAVVLPGAARAAQAGAAATGRGCCSSSSGSRPRCASTRQGERFIRAVEATGGPELLARVWEGPEHAAHHGGDPPPRRRGWRASGPTRLAAG